MLLTFFEVVRRKRIMALINCPECGKENVSKQAIACPNCGFGIRAYYETIKRQEEIERQELDLKKQEEDRINEEIESIQMPTKPSLIVVVILIIISLIVGTILFMLISMRFDNVIMALIISIISNIIIAVTIIKDYLDKVKRYNFALQNFKEYQEEQFQKRVIYMKRPASNSKTLNNKVQCPFCHSTNVVAISGVERAFSLITLGIFSRKINKSFECNDCGGTF